MGRWYIGKVSTFDAKTGRHTVQFKDGDKREYLLRHEAVVWLDVPGLNGDEVRAQNDKSFQFPTQEVFSWLHLVLEKTPVETILKRSWKPVCGMAAGPCWEYLSVSTL